MTDYSSGPESEPSRDVRLGLMLRETIGATPDGDVNWTSLAKRIGDRLPVPLSAPWWSYAARWERRAIPLALAAGLVGAVALWGTPGISTSGAMEEMITAIASGVPARDAASQFTNSIMETMELSAGLPE